MDPPSEGEAAAARARVQLSAASAERVAVEPGVECGSDARARPSDGSKARQYLIWIPPNKALLLFAEGACGGYEVEVDGKAWKDGL